MAESTTKAVVKQGEKGTLLDRLMAHARTPEERERAFLMAERYRQQQVMQELAGEVLAKSWGDKVSPQLRYQMIRFAMDIGADPTRHVDVLGGKPYLNAAFYQELVTSTPGFLRAEEQWAHQQAELNEEEAEIRRQLRVQHAIPLTIGAQVGRFKEDRRAHEGKPAIPVLAACIVTLHFEKRGPFVGVKWSPSRAVDDVGMDHPEQSAKTRAYRKAAMQAVSPWFNKHPLVARMEESVIIANATDVRETMPAALPAAEVETTGERVPESRGDSTSGKQDGEDAPHQPPAPTPPKMVKHNPSAKCGREGEHPESECGYEMKP